MKKYKCPNCNQLTFSLWKKLFIGPFNKKACKSCGAQISVPFGISLFVIIVGQLLAFLGLALALLLVPTPVPLTTSLIFMHVGYVVGVIPFVYAYANIVPLVNKNT